MNTDWSTICHHITQANTQTFNAEKITPQGGGCINQTFVLRDGTQQFFLKLNHSRHQDMLESEAFALQQLAASNTIRVPRVICSGIAAQQAFLVLEHLDLSGSKDPHQLAEQLAALHHCTARSFGLEQDNFIGTTTQPNTQSNDWVNFYRHNRLQHQLDLAKTRSCRSRLLDLGAQLVHQLPVFFDHKPPVASLLHGDLWSGNYSYLCDGTPVIFDPASYYGDREADIAMTELFGGFSHHFYDAYNHHWPLDNGYKVRKDLYNLYHILNHGYLFGSAYYNQAEQMIQRLMAAIR